jgi:hypothetical protein
MSPSRWQEIGKSTENFHRAEKKDAQWENLLGAPALI